MIEIKNLSLSLDGQNNILKNINLKMEKGKIYGLIGPNGVGKTTLIKCLTGIYEPNIGKVLYDGINVYNSSEVKGKIAYVADENNFFSSFTIEKIIEYFSLAYEKFDEKRFEEMNSFFKIDIKKKYNQLSKGQRIRIYLMIALAQNSDYIILDEPTAGLDPILKNKLLYLLQKEREDREVTIIISSHHLNELEKICDDVIIVNNGEISYVNTLENMKNKIKKIQVAFDMPVYEEDLNIEGIFKISRVGRVFTIITDDYSEVFLEKLKKFNPLFIEEIDLTLEDIFIYRVEKEDMHEEIC
ncbi:ABC transporter ATP-binding protein [uncultured Clostridium sp.]|uniref:ABC transporter ATP-binding protein n=1 Tax=uncultured Clostridium sp. TaxID=59620 RepID=UPI0025FDCFE8|nr:ABC transporter ATP-binding protein [uncultured Clostridium sp.]